MSFQRSLVCHSRWTGPQRQHTLQARQKEDPAAHRDKRIVVRAGQSGCGICREWIPACCCTPYFAVLSAYCRPPPQSKAPLAPKGSEGSHEGAEENQAFQAALSTDRRDKSATDYSHVLLRSESPCSVMAGSPIDASSGAIAFGGNQRAARRYAMATADRLTAPPICRIGDSPSSPPSDKIGRPSPFAPEPEADPGSLWQTFYHRVLARTGPGRIFSAAVFSTLRRFAMSRIAATAFESVSRLRQWASGRCLSADGTGGICQRTGSKRRWDLFCRNRLPRIGKPLH